MIKRQMINRIFQGPKKFNFLYNSEIVGIWVEDDILVNN